MRAAQYTPNLKLPDGTDTVSRGAYENNLVALDAFNGTHKHTGAAGDAPKVGSDGLVAGAANDTAIGNRTISDTLTPTGNSGSLTQVVSWLANQLKGIKGSTSWSAAPAATIQTLQTSVQSLGSFDGSHTHTGNAGDAPKIGSTGIQAGAANDTIIGTRTVDDTLSPTANAGNLAQLLSWLANQIKGIKGGTSIWSSGPATDLTTVKAHLGARGAAHGLAVDGGEAGFMSGTEKACIVRLNTGTTNPTATSRLNCDGYFYATRVYNAVYNDYAEFRQLRGNSLIAPGTVVTQKEDGYVSVCEKRLSQFAEIVSDTYGVAIGEYQADGEVSIPVAVVGRVLATPDRAGSRFRFGDAVCSGSGGTVSRMRWWERVLFPHRRIGYVVEVPLYARWRNSVDVNGRIWIKLG